MSPEFWRHFVRYVIPTGIAFWVLVWWVVRG